MSELRFFGRSLRSLVGILAALMFANSTWGTYLAENGRIAFSAKFTGTWQLFTLNPDGTELFQVTNLPPTENPFWFPDYSPDGRQLVFCHDMTGAVELYVINVDGTGLRQVTNDGTENLFPRWSPDGTRILFSTLFIGDRFGYHHLATIQPDGSDRQLLTDVLFDDYQAEYTTDGKHIIFASTRRNQISALWMMNAKGSNEKQIIQAALEGGGPDVSPDGQHIVFYDRQNTDLPGSLWMARTDGSQLVRLTSSDQLNAGSPVFSPDGKEIVFNGGPPTGISGDITVMNTDGSGIKVILSCPDGCALPDWGPKPIEDSARNDNMGTSGPRLATMNPSLKSAASGAKSSSAQMPTIGELACPVRLAWAFSSCAPGEPDAKAVAVAVPPDSRREK